jgi:hypothetical protein
MLARALSLCVALLMGMPAVAQTTVPAPAGAWWLDTNVSPAVWRQVSQNFPLPSGLNAVTTGGWTPKSFVAANSDNATNLKNSAGIVHAVEVYGIGSAPAYLKFYDKASSPTCASDTIIKQIMIPAAGTATNGAGSNAIAMDAQFSTGISYCVVTGIAANDDTSVAAATFIINIDWK